MYDSTIYSISCCVSIPSVQSCVIYYIYIHLLYYLYICVSLIALCGCLLGCFGFETRVNCKYVRPVPDRALPQPPLPETVGVVVLMGPKAGQINITYELYYYLQLPTCNYFQVPRIKAPPKLLQLRNSKRIKTIKTFWVFGFSGLQAAQVQPHKHIHIYKIYVCIILIYHIHIQYTYIYNVPVYMRYNYKMYI